MSAPNVGVKISAEISEAESVAISVIGRYFMNWPTIPGQKSKGEKAAIRVSVAATTGPDMRLAAKAYASFGFMPSAIRRSANSATMMASSTSMPTARMRLNSTTMFIV